MRTKTGILLAMLGLIVGFLIGSLIWANHDMRAGQIKALKGEWMIRADSVHIDTVYYVTID